MNCRRWYGVTVFISFLDIATVIASKNDSTEEKMFSHTAVSKEDFFELTVGRAKTLGSTAAFIIFQ